MATSYRRLQAHCKELGLKPCNAKADTLQRTIDEVQLPAPNPELYIGVLDADRQIYLNLNGAQLLNACSVNHYTRSVCDDSFWAMKARIEFGDGVRGDNRALYAELYPLNAVKRLWWACERGYIHIVMFIVSNGVDIHANDENALFLAVKHGHLEIVRYLVAQGADIHAENEYAIRWAAANGHLKVVEYFVAQGADIHAVDEHTICLAAVYGHLEVVKYLVAQGADLHAENEYAICIAAENGHLAVVKYLKSLN